jgi:ABC-2 type transport system ATP-binding protein
MRILVGWLRADAGEVPVFGADPWRHGAKVRRVIGYLASVAGLYGRMRGRQPLGAFVVGGRAGGADGRGVRRVGDGPRRP